MLRATSYVRRAGVLRASCVMLLLGVPVDAQQQAPATKPAATMAATTGQWWDMISRSFVALADAMPEEKYSFAPRDGEFKGVRTFAEQVKHVACANYAFFQEIEKKTPPDACETGGSDPAKTKTELLAYLRKSFEYGAEVMKKMTPENALDAAGGRYGGESTRLGLTTLAVWHASDHYGQLVIYLRMNGIVPPASR